MKTCSAGGARKRSPLFPVRIVVGVDGSPGSARMRPSSSSAATAPAACRGILIGSTATAIVHKARARLPGDEHGARRLAAAEIATLTSPRSKVVSPGLPDQLVPRKAADRLTHELGADDADHRRRQRPCAEHGQRPARLGEDRRLASGLDALR